MQKRTLLGTLGLGVAGITAAVTTVPAVAVTGRSAPVPTDATGATEDKTPSLGSQSDGALHDIATATRYINAVKALSAKFGDRVGLIGTAGGDAYIRIPVVNLTDADEALAQEVSSDNGIKLVLEPALVSASELQTLNARVKDILSSSGLKTWSVGIDTSAARVSVGFPNDASNTDSVNNVSALVEQEAASYVQSLGAQRALTQADVLTFELNDSFYTADARTTGPFSSGNWIYDRGTCTTGPLLVNGSFYGTTAGHCGGSNQVGHVVVSTDQARTDTGYRYGTTDKNTWHDHGVDAERFPLTAGDPGFSRVFISSNGYKTISGVVATQYQVDQLALCAVGWGMQNQANVGYKCGQIHYVNRTMTADGVTDDGLNCVEFEVYGGDSGGLVYFVDSNGQADAAGITVISDNPSGIGYSHHYDCFEPIESVEFAMAASLVTQK
ncbi:MAG: S1 family peptidase [Actinomycetota bacterium]|nr:S1 family peptidase [Actinomycetota bacterium]